MKIRKIIAGTVAAALSLICASFNVCAYPSGATAVKNAEQLMSMKAGGKYYLTNDIDLSGVKWKGISGFYGSFDGNGYEISGMKSDTYGLFSSVKTGADIKNVKLTDVYITSKYKSVGAVVSVIQNNQKNISIDNCYVSGLVASCRTKYFLDTSSSTAGAIVGTNSSASAVISGCYSNAVVASERTVGGIAGINKGTIKDCGFGGQLGSAYNIYELGCDEYGAKREDYKYLYSAGGLCGCNYGKISNSFSNCTRVDVASYYGGIAGIHNSGKISYCVNSSEVLYDDTMSGGHIAGYVSGKASLLNCYSKKSTKATVQNDVGKGNSKAITYVVSAEKYGKISSFKRLDGDWTISGGVPVLKKLVSYTKEQPIWIIKGERLVSNMSVDEEYDDDDSASVDYGYDDEGNILE